jgi:RNA polymerase sigma-70 factor (ECF subfamily)
MVTPTNTAERSHPRLRVVTPLSPPPTSGDDAAIVAGVRSGDEQAADALFDRLHPIVQRTLQRILRASSGEVEDLVQATFERIIVTIVEGRFAGACSLTTWASAIAAHVGIDALRTRVRERRLFQSFMGSDPEAGSLASSQPLERSLEARDEVARLQATLARMRPDQARTLLLHDGLGYDLAEVALLTGVTVAAAQSRLVRGRKELLRRYGVRTGRSR